MKPILKWHGGKSSEIKVICEHMPKEYKRFVEPFVGGGAMFFYLENKESILNDFNKELVCFYEMIKNPGSLAKFEEIIRVVAKERLQASSLLDDDTLQDKAKAIRGESVYHKYLDRELKSKEKIILRLNAGKIEKDIVLLTDEEKRIHRVTGVNAALYYFYRELYNQKLRDNSYDIEHIAYWFVMREIGYSGMFRHSKSGNFNVPYGGISYNNKNLLNKLNEILILNEKEFYKNAQFTNGDFQKFFEKYDYFKEDDFIFLDPPYDSEFSQYNKEEDFTKDDQIRLRDTLLKTKAKIMVIIKETEFIYNLYKDDFIVERFEKNYSVNFKNRNDREVSHLIIKNYK